MGPVEPYSHVSAAPNACIHEKQAHTHTKFHRTEYTLPDASYSFSRILHRFYRIIRIPDAKVRAKMQLVVRSDTNRDVTIVTLINLRPMPEYVRIRVMT
jgi:hypothetical protein